MTVLTWLPRVHRALRSDAQPSPAVVDMAVSTAGYGTLLREGDLLFHPVGKTVSFITDIQLHLAKLEDDRIYDDKWLE